MVNFDTKIKIHHFSSFWKICSFFYQKWNFDTLWDLVRREVPSGNCIRDISNFINDWRPDRWWLSNSILFRFLFIPKSHNNNWNRHSFERRWTDKKAFVKFLRDHPLSFGGKRKKLCNVTYKSRSRGLRRRVCLKQENKEERKNEETTEETKTENNLLGIAF